MKLNVSSDCRAWVFYPIFSFSLALGIPGSLDVLKIQYLKRYQLLSKEKSVHISESLSRLKLTRTCLSILVFSSFGGSFILFVIYFFPHALFLRLPRSSAVRV